MEHKTRLAIGLRVQLVAGQVDAFVRFAYLFDELERFLCNQPNKRKKKWRQIKRLNSPGGSECCRTNLTFSFHGLVVQVDGFNGGLLIGLEANIVGLQENAPIAWQANELVALLVVLDLNVVLEVGGRADFDVAAASGAGVGMD